MSVMGEGCGDGRFLAAGRYELHDSELIATGKGSRHRWINIIWAKQMCQQPSKDSNLDRHPLSRRMAQTLGMSSTIM